MSIRKSFPLFIMRTFTFGTARWPATKDTNGHCGWPMRHTLAPHTTEAQVSILNHSSLPILSPHPLTLQFSKLPVSALNYSFHPCSELGLHEPCFVFLFLICTLCSNDSGSSPKLPDKATHPSSTAQSSK